MDYNRCIVTNLHTHYTIMILSHPHHSTISRQEQFRLAKQALSRRDRGYGLIATGLGLVLSVIIELIWLQPLLKHIPASLAIPMIALVIGGRCLIVGWQRYTFHRRLQTATTIAHATIIDCWIESAFDGEPGVIAWELTVTRPDGRQMSLRQADLIDPALVARWQASTAPVRYLPDNPAISTLAIDLLAESIRPL
ncbi:hypothetical protein [Chloroflexus sp.]|uniref:hypothetical protein n=1 Tax=Chloroflexus sp. TaxID=1904827 RepID=UPI002632C40B|nr:hypothetical protein [uncultured Chloroflexus sp.]